ncbi:hypothetical protein [Novosphingobium pentaromativorans]|nr:hypothetical protein [Novosphingobium pentaromativorans]
MNEVADLPWARKIASRTQAFQVICVDGGTLTYRASAANGDPLDAMALNKS